jgi:hypothetical protein
MEHSPKSLAVVICKAIMRYGEISHDDVVTYLGRIDSAYISESRTGRYSKIAPKILKEIRQHGGDQIVWCRRSLLWRSRHDGDDPGRTQDE